MISVPLAAVVGCFGCSGDINGNSATSTGNGEGGPSSAGGAGGGIAPPGSGGTSATKPSAGAGKGPSSGQRLTKQEYLNTLSDLLRIDAALFAASLPPDATSATTGFRNSLDAQTTAALRSSGFEVVASSVAATVRWTGGLASFAACTDRTPACQTGFVRRLASLLYRRPATDPEAANLVRLFSAVPDDPFEAGARLVLYAALQSPHFIYRLERTDRAAPTPFEVVTRLAFLFWKSAPDEALLALAGQGSLLTDAQVQALIQNLLADPRARRGIRDYADDWIGLYRLEDRSPDSKTGVTSATLRDMRDETLRAVTRVAFEDGGDLRRLFTEERTELTPALGKLYGLNLTGTWQVVDLAPDPRRRGILTHPGVLTVHAGAEHASIVDRGLVVLRSFLCGNVPNPPDAVITQFETIPPNLTDREKFALHSESPVCAACHAAIDALGYPFEPYDVAGRHRTKDAYGNVLREDGAYTIDGTRATFRDVEEFATLVGESKAAEACLVRKLYQYAYGRPLVAEDETQVTRIEQAFKAGGRAWKALAQAVAGATEFRGKAVQ